MTRAAIDHQVWSSTHKNNTEQTVNTQQMTAAMVVKEMDEYQQSKQAEQKGKKEATRWRLTEQKYSNTESETEQPKQKINSWLKKRSRNRVTCAVDG